jgi:NAD(P)-dependent dehydrogenase (short-subunit alcohol dehydrogenase family)
METDSPAGRVAVVTGAARGIGDAIARVLVDAGMRVVCLDRLEPTSPRAGVRYVVADVSDPDSVAEAFSDVDRAEGRLDVLVNNAGIQRVGRIGDLSFEDWAAVVGTHLTGSFLCCSQAVPRMLARETRGAIVSVASVAAIVGIPGRGPYCAAKAGILGLTRALALEVAPAGIRVNAVAPGYTRTELIQQALDDGSQREDWMLQRVPLGRLATPDEIAGVVLFLASDQAEYVTGQVVVADGGWTIQGVLHAPEWLTAPATKPPA